MLQITCSLHRATHRFSIILCLLGPYECRVTATSDTSITCILPYLPAGSLPLHAVIHPKGMASLENLDQKHMTRLIQYKFGKPNHSCHGNADHLLLITNIAIALFPVFL